LVNFEGTARFRTIQAKEWYFKTYSETFVDELELNKTAKKASSNQNQRSNLQQNKTAADLLNYYKARCL